MSDTTGRGRMRRARARGISLLVTTLALTGVSAILAPAATAMAAPQADISIEVTPTAATEGESVTVTITAEDTFDLYAYDLAFTVDPALLALDPDSITGPDGGFTTASIGGSTITLTHTRLGTSPGLEGDVTLGSFSLIALGGGSTPISLDSAALVSTGGDATDATTPAPVVVTLAALPDPPVEPEPTATAVPSPTGTPAALPVSGRPINGPLAATGADATPWLLTGAGAVVLIAVGTVLAIRRRRAVSE